MVVVEGVDLGGQTQSPRLLTQTDPSAGTLFTCATRPRAKGARTVAFLPNPRLAITFVYVTYYLRLALSKLPQRGAVSLNTAWPKYCCARNHLKVFTKFRSRTYTGVTVYYDDCKLQSMLGSFGLPVAACVSTDSSICCIRVKCVSKPSSLPFTVSSLLSTDPIRCSRVGGASFEA